MTTEAPAYVVSPTYYPPATAAIFDMDGLLVDSEPFWRRVEIEVFAAIGVDIVPLLGSGLTMGMRVDEVVAFFRSRVGWDEPSDAVIVERVVAGIVEAVWEEVELLPGAIEAIEHVVARDMSVALASGSVPPVIDAVLDRFCLREHFSVISSAADDVLGKPHPAIFLRTAAALDVDPLACVVLEDSINGCIAAKAARMRVVAVPDERFAAEAKYAIADVRLASLFEIDGPRVAEVLGWLPPGSPA